MKYLNKPLTLETIHLKNRLVMAPMASGKGSTDGSVTEAVLAYYKDKLRTGNIGLVITEHCFISPEGRAGIDRHQLSVADDTKIEGLKKLADVIHEGGAAAAVQISHAGAAARTEITGCQTVGPVAEVLYGANPAKSDLPKALTEQEIQNLIEKFADAAERVKKAGFDGVEIHAAHRYLCNQFYSPLTNKRTDEYNGTSLEGRTLFLKQVIKAVREKVGDAFCVMIRLGGCDYMPGGNTIEDAAKAAAILEETGVDILDLSGGICGPRNPESTQPGYFREMTTYVKKRITTPVILTGGITDLAAAEDLLQDGCADLIGVGRALLKDSDWPKDLSAVK